MYEYIIGEMENDGVALYEHSNAKSIYDAPTGKVGAKGWAQRIYMILLGAGLLGWFVYSLIVAAGQQGVKSAILGHLLAFFILLMSETILMLTAFGGWGKFARSALKYRIKRKRRIDEAKVMELEEELQTADDNKSNEYALRIYRDFVVVVNGGEKTLIKNSDLRSVKCERVPHGFQLKFFTCDGEEVVAKEILPVADVTIIRNYLKNFNYVPVKREKGYLRKKLPMIAFMCIPILIGVGLILLRSLLLHDMPIIFGIVFLALGSLNMIAQFRDFAVINYGILPILGGLVIMGIPIGIWLTLADLLKRSPVSLLLPFSAIHAVLSVFLGLGAMLSILGIFGFINCFKIK